MHDLQLMLHQVLAERPNLTAREIAWRIRSKGTTVSKRDVNPLLYRDPSLLQDGGYVPRWRLASQVAARADLTTRVASKRDQRRRLDQRQDQVAALRAGDATLSDIAEANPELIAAIALLREHGVQVGDTPSPKLVSGRSVPTDASRPKPDSEVGTSRRRAPAEPRIDAAAKPTATPLRVHPPVPAPDWTIGSLRPWQQEALLSWYRAGCVGVCEAVTGTGKTHLGLEAVAQTIRGGGRATVLVPSVLLQRQWELKLQEFVPGAVIAKVGGSPRGDATTADVVVAVVHSASRADLTRAGSGVDLLVADEVHRYGGQGWSVALRDGYERRLGLTATLERGGDDGVDSYLLPFFSSVVHSYGYDRATRENVVAPFDLIFLGVSLQDEELGQYETLSRRISQARKVLIGAGGASPANLHQQLGSLRTVGGDVTRAVIAYETGTRARRRLLADTPAKHEALRQLAEFVRESNGSVIFTQSVETAIAAADLLKAEDMTAEAIYSASMSAGRRQQLISDLSDGALQALASPKILDEGVDVPDVNLGIVMGASSSRRQMIQRLGRVIRLKQDSGRARFAILYVNDTVEDPETGARADFMTEVEDAATRVVLMRHWGEDDLDAVWAGGGPQWVQDAVAETAPTAQVARVNAVANSASMDLLASRAPDRRRVPRSQMLPRPKRPRPPTDFETADLLGQIEETRELLALMRADEVQERTLS